MGRRLIFGQTSSWPVWFSTLRCGTFYCWASWSPIAPYPSHDAIFTGSGNIHAISLNRYATGTRLWSVGLSWNTIWSPQDESGSQIVKKGYVGLTDQGRVLLVKLPAANLVKKFCTIYGSWRFIRTRQWSHSHHYTLFL
jgi:hypothetical protein